MKLLKSKKADGNMWWVIAIAILVLLVVILILVWFRSSGDKAFGEVGKKIDSLGDCDNDNVANMWDKCSCDPEDANAEVDGCPSSIKKDTPKDNPLLTKVAGKDCTCKT
jgi:flagellar basal body-associated protein FliL